MSSCDGLAWDGPALAWAGVGVVVCMPVQSVVNVHLGMHRQILSDTAFAQPKTHSGFVFLFFTACQQLRKGQRYRGIDSLAKISSMCRASLVVFINIFWVIDFKKFHKKK